jgi:hypothetical protein
MDPDTMEMDADAVVTDPDTVEMDPDALVTDPDTAEMNPNTVGMDPGTNKVKSGYKGPILYSTDEALVSAFSVAHLLTGWLCPCECLVWSRPL